jgi:hypothetical protein
LQSINIPLDLDPALGVLFNKEAFRNESKIQLILLAYLFLMNVII